MKDRKRKWNNKMITLIIITFCIVGINISLFTTLTSKEVEKVATTYTNSEFMAKVKEGEVKQVEIPSNVNKKIMIEMENGDIAFTPNPGSSNLREQLVSMDVNVISNEKTNSSSFFGSFLMQILTGVIVLIIVMFLFRKFAGNRGAGGQPPVKKENKRLTDEKTHRYAKFDDIAIDETTKESLWEVVEYLKDPTKFEKVGAKAPNGVLLFGPPGTGKTLLARTVAGEAKVPFLAATGASFNEMYVGVGASRVRELFEEARKLAPAIIFIDELDSLGAKRGHTSNSESVQTITELLAEMDGFKDNKGIVVIATTNRKDSLDEAVIRSGRFSKHIEVPLPDIEDREAILKVHIRNKKLAEDVDIPRLAKLTSGFSGADLEELMNESALFSLRRKSDSITWADTQDAFEAKILGPKKKKSTWSKFENDVVAYHEVGHALASIYIAEEVFERITVNPAGNAGGYVLRSPKNSKLSTKKQLFNDICISMGGRVAETIIFGEENVTTGAQQDFRQASQRALEMVFAYGMSDMGVMAIPRLDESMWTTLSPEVRNQAQREMSKILKEAEDTVTKLLNEKRDELEALTQHIKNVKTMDGEEVVSFLKNVKSSAKEENNSTIQRETVENSSIALATIEENNK